MEPRFTAMFDPEGIHKVLDLLPARRRDARVEFNNFGLNSATEPLMNSLGTASSNLFNTPLLNRFGGPVSTDRDECQSEAVQNDREGERRPDFYRVRVQAQARRCEVFIPLGREFRERRPGGIDLGPGTIRVFPERVAH